MNACHCFLFKTMALFHCHWGGNTTGQHFNEEEAFCLLCIKSWGDLFWLACIYCHFNSLFQEETKYSNHAHNHLCFPPSQMIHPYLFNFYIIYIHPLWRDTSGWSVEMLADKLMGWSAVIYYPGDHNKTKKISNTFPVIWGLHVGLGSKLLHPNLTYFFSKPYWLILTPQTSCTLSYTSSQSNHLFKGLHVKDEW